MHEETLSSERPFEGQRFAVRVDRVRQANGRETVREVVEHGPAMAAVPLLPDGRVILVRQWRHPAQRELLEIPAGMMDPGETPEECVSRELAEEIGYQPGRVRKLFSVYLAPGYSEEMIHIFLAEDLTPHKLPADDDENIETVIVPLAEAVTMCREGQIQDAKSVAGLLGAAQPGLW